MTQQSIRSFFPPSPLSSTISASSSSIFPPILPVEEIDTSFNADLSVNISRIQLEKIVTVQLVKLRELREKLLGSEDSACHAHAGGCSHACHDEKVVKLSDDTSSEDSTNKTSSEDADSMVVDSDDNDTDIDDNDADIDDDNDTDSMEVDNDDSLSGRRITACKENPDCGGRVPMHASLAELAESISNMGRDGYVKALAGNPGYTFKSRNRSDYDNDGIIYMILNRRNLKVYVGKTDNVDVRFRNHLSGNGGARDLQRAIAKYGPQNFVCGR